jgi:gliding motility-associated-like protein
MTNTRLFISIRKILSLITLALPLAASSQIVVDGGGDPTEIASSLVGSGVTISDVTMDCEDGAYGTFECIDCNVGIGSGIVLTSGDVSVAEGPNTGTGDTGAWGGSGDDDLDDISGFTTYDACILEFDVTVTSDTLVFNYSFGSEEYTTYVNSTVNDAFGLFISGPGITGLENLALIPGTDIGISINTVNPLEYDEYYIDNGVGCTPSGDYCIEGFLTSPYSTDEYYIGYDGFTTVLTAKTPVIPCETYHLKLAIADAGDDVLDSGVFIEAGSLSSPGVEITYETDLGGYPDLIEGCNDGNIILDLSFAPVDTFEVILNVTGSATSGVDYEAFPTIIEFLPGEVTISLPIEVFIDGLPEGLETIVITVESGGCITGIGDSLVINVHDYLPLTITPIDTVICPGASYTIIAEGASTYSWSPGETLNTTSGDEVIATPEESPTVYSVTGTLGTCVNTVTSTVELSPPLANAGNDTTIIISESAVLDASGGTSYSWTPTSTLSNPNIANPIATPTVTTTYTVTVTDANGCVSSDEVTVFVSNDPIIVFPNAFTPNGDGINDLFSMINRGILAGFNLQIYNRWGELIFESNADAGAWDGTFNGEEQPVGNYVYVFNASDFEGNTYNAQGYFTLVR